MKLLDGTGISMPDTAENQAVFPQPTTQSVGVGFPLLRLCALIDLASGAVLKAATGAHRGAGHSELDLSRTLLGGLCAGDVLLADALYANYWLIAELTAAGVDVVLQQHGSRRTDFRRGQRLGVHDHVVQWPKPEHVPSWMSRAQYRAVADTLTLREVRVGGRVLVTTLRDPRAVAKTEIAALYQRRWHIELDLRCIKTTLGMEVLRLPDPGHGREGTVDIPAGLQPDPSADGPSRRRARWRAARAEFQAHRAAVERVQCPLPVPRRDRQSRAPLSAHCTATRRPSSLTA